MGHFPNCRGKKSFSKKSGCHAQFHNGGKDGQTLFHGILPATAWALASKTAVNWHLKVKDIEYNVGLSKNYCITVSMQKSSSIHKLILRILGSHKLNDHAHF